MFQGMHYIYEVYKERSFSKAAQNLYISQPSLSAAVRKIENRIGSPLFDRSTSPIRLTDCGREYIRCAEKIMDIQNEFESYINGQNELQTGQLSIGASNLFASYVLPSCISHFTRKYPHIDIHLAEANSPVLTERLLDGSLDLMIDSEELSENICARYPLFTDQVLLAVPEKYLPERQYVPKPLTSADILENCHKASGTSQICLQVFEHSPFLLLRHGNATRRCADMLCRQQSFSPDIILELDQQATAYHLACYGMGITFVSDTLIRKAPAGADTFFFRLDPVLSVRTVYFYHKKGKYVTRAMEEFLKTAKKDLS